jgi:hypothetical protein
LVPNIAMLRRVLNMLGFPQLQHHIRHEQLSTHN